MNSGISIVSSWRSSRPNSILDKSKMSLTKFAPKYADIYGIDHSSETLESSLDGAGLSPGDITDLIITHFHFDHAGGVTERDGERFRLVFPNARHLVQEEHWKWAREPNIREKSSFLPENMLPLQEEGVLNLLPGPTEILPGIEIVVSHGHTRAQQLVKISDGETTLLYCADLIPTTTHLRLPFTMGYDIAPLTVIEEKKRLLEEAALNGWICFFEHDPKIAAATVREGGKDFEVDEVVLRGAG